MAGVLSILSDINVVELGGEPKIKDIELGRRLEMKAPERIRNKIEEHRDELKFFGNLHTDREFADSKRKRVVTVYYLSEEQALTICTLIKTDKAALVRQILVRTFVAYRRGKLLEAVSNSEIRHIVEDYVHGPMEIAVQQYLKAVINDNILPPSSPPKVPIGFERIGSFFERKGIRPVTGRVKQAISRDVRKYCETRGYKVIAKIGNSYREGRAYPTDGLEEWWNDGGSLIAKDAAIQSSCNDTPLFLWGELYS